MDERKHCKSIVPIRLHLSNWENQDSLKRQMNRSTSFPQLTVIILFNSRIGDEKGELIRTRTVIDSPVGLRIRDTCRRFTGNLLVGLESLELCHRREKYRIQWDEHELVATSTYLNPLWWTQTCLRINHLSMSIILGIRRIALIQSLIDHFSFSKNRCSWLASDCHSIIVSIGLGELTIFRPGWAFTRHDRGHGD